MSNIDYQNGFICGMATKGIIRSGEYYKPTCWNDSGNYSYFYIDFHKLISEFTLGMFSESIIVADANQLPVTDVQYVSPGIYKIICDISTCVTGVTIMNKATSLLSYYTSGLRVPVFSVHFYVNGMASYMRLQYCYDKKVFAIPIGAATENIPDFNLWTAIALESAADSATFSNPITGSVVESADVVLI